MVVVLDELYGLPGTSGGVGVLDGRYFAPGDALGRPHYPLESLTVMDGAVAVPGGETARQVATLAQMLSTLLSRDWTLASSMLGSGARCARLQSLTRRPSAPFTASLFWFAGWDPIHCPGWWAKQRIRFGKVVFLIVMMVS